VLNSVLPVESTTSALLEGRDQFAELGVDRAAVVALVVVLDDRLPVGCNGVDDSGSADEIGQWIVGQEGVGSGQLVDQESRFGWLEVDPQKTPPRVDCDRMKRKVFLPQAVTVIEIGGSTKAPIEGIGPGVIGALNRTFESAGWPICACPGLPSAASSTEPR
jgi:hypothetical protein